MAAGRESCGDRRGRADGGGVRQGRDRASSFDTPEDIDDGEYTHPSRRIEDLMPSYHKRVDGPVLAGRMGPSTIRAECRGFNEWVTRLESLNQR